MPLILYIEVLCKFSSQYCFHRCFWQWRQTLHFLPLWSFWLTLSWLQERR